MSEFQGMYIALPSLGSIDSCGSLMFLSLPGGSVITPGQTGSVLSQWLSLIYLTAQYSPLTRTDIAHIRHLVLSLALHTGITSIVEVTL